ncbi:NAD(P)/FAD-dependent oxidoreductase [Bosea sp. (in: a-proteobacteria)]|uniref:FAD/NAD(P)-dependent oxidoreductase n=1 Tax=Bosea sp. (in: a-proteobacteria) TaxID=1871050 RepID=UPI0025BCD7B0|nr:NAD(P)/FAD-dependent oxidoreductase [Bosea sp. (in: a-proteobacteria)]MBR3189787.1 FAD-dependent oxidoreductase [Bosea sp. (in: a-proteobacteria)]
MSGSVDLAIIGAGPAGMAAAITARRHRLTVTVIDEQPAPGGQIFRSVTEPAPLPTSVLGPDYHAGRTLAERFLACGADYRPGSLVWQEEKGTLDLSGPDGPQSLQAKRIILASGAMERPFPIPGWTLPGVMTAGAAQILLKTTASVAPGAVFAGSGPLIYLIVAQYARAGVPVAALLDTTPRGARLKALRHLPSALMAPSYLRKGLGLLAEIRRAGIKVVRHVEALRIEGESAVRGISWHAGGERGEIATGTVFLHQGVIPNVNLAMALGCRHAFDESQRCWRPERDRWGRSSRDDILIAGDAGGILGAASAELSGKIAALAACADLGRLSQEAAERAAAPVFGMLRRESAIRPFLEALYPPAPQFLAPRDDDTLVCRCEEVTRGAVAAAVAEQCQGPNQLKAFTRAGMGPCQGRMCGHSLTETMAALTGRSPAEIGYLRIRMPVKPVTLGDIAGPSEQGRNAA